MATTKRRFGREDSESRAKLLDAAAQVMLEEGYAAVSSRRVAERAELKPQLVHYYFRTMDDLFIALLDRSTEIFFVEYTRALTSKTPIKALWELARDDDGSVLLMEFMALANHRKAIKTKIAKLGRQLRKMRTEVIAKALSQHDIDHDEFPPIAVSIVMDTVARSMGLDRALGVTEGLDDVEEMVTRFIERYELQPEA